MLKQEVKMSNNYYITQEGLNKLKKELEKLTTIERPVLSQMIADAREKGDIRRGNFIYGIPYILPGKGN